MAENDVVILHCDVKVQGNVLAGYVLIQDGNFLKPTFSCSLTGSRRSTKQSGNEADIHHCLHYDAFQQKHLLFLVHPSKDDITESSCPDVVKWFSPKARK